MKINLSMINAVLIVSVLMLSGCSSLSSAAVEISTETATVTVTQTAIFLTPAPYLDMWTTFSNPKFGVSLDYPGDWQPVAGYGSSELGDVRYGAINGFFQIGAMDADSIDQASVSEADHKLQPYGSQPMIETLEVQGQDARLIIPSEDQPDGLQHQAALIVRYPQPVDISGTAYRYFVLYADLAHIRTIAETLVFSN
jgi:TolB protein